MSSFGPLRQSSRDLWKKVALPTDDLQTRRQDSRAALVRQAGGTTESARVVVRALGWLVKHQNADGSWSLDHRRDIFQGECSDAGSKRPSRNGAMALVLLPFLGTGETHQ